MTDNNSPLVTLVDIFDNPIGECSKEDAHSFPRLHRAFSVYLYSGNKMLIQRRALSKYHSGGLWSNSCCSHPRPGETLREAVADRLPTELGISCDADELFSFIYYNRFNDSLYEYEFDHVFLGEFNGELTLNPDEAMDAKWVEISELEKMLVETPSLFSVWFLSSAPRVIAEIKKRNKN